jgi:hypothetical protein
MLSSDIAYIKQIVFIHYMKVLHLKVNYSLDPLTAAVLPKSERLAQRR